MDGFISLLAFWLGGAGAVPLNSVRVEALTSTVTFRETVLSTVPQVEHVIGVLSGE